MCETCFNTEVYGFVSQEEFETFDIELNKKIKPLTKTGLIYKGNTDFSFDRGYGTYICQDCMTEWWYSEPEQSWRGFFVRKENGKKVIAEYLEESDKKSSGCFSVLAIMSIVYWIVSSY